MHPKWANENIESRLLTLFFLDVYGVCAFWFFLHWTLNFLLAHWTQIEHFWCQRTNFLYLPVLSDLLYIVCVYLCFGMRYNIAKRGVSRIWYMVHCAKSYLDILYRRIKLYDALNARNTHIIVSNLQSWLTCKCASVYTLHACNRSYKSRQNTKLSIINTIYNLTRWEKKMCTKKWAKKEHCKQCLDIILSLFTSALCFSLYLIFVYTQFYLLKMLRTTI